MAILTYGYLDLHTRHRGCRIHLLSKPTRVFISYRHEPPDEKLAAEIEERLMASGISTFRDTGIPVGATWEDEIGAALAKCSHLIVLLSPRSIASDMVREEVRRVYERMKRGEAEILPVWINDPLDLKYGLSSWLNPLQYARWQETEGYEAIGDILVDAVVSLRPLPFSQFDAQPEEQQRVLGRAARASASEDLLARCVQNELRPAMNQIFRVVSQPADVSAILAPPRSDHSDLPYVRRKMLAGTLDSELLRNLHANGKVLVAGRAGLGKTREIAEVAGQMLRVGWVAYVFESSLLKLEIPRNIDSPVGKKTLLVFDGIGEGEAVTNAPVISAWLEQLLEQFGKKLTARDLRVLVSARSEPLQLETRSPLWRQFYEFSLQEFPKSDLRDMLRWLTENRGVLCSPSDFTDMVADSDQTPAMIVNHVEIACNRGEPLTIELWRQLRRVDWSECYPRLRETPGVVQSLWSIILLNGAHLPTSSQNVVELAARLGGIDATAALQSLLDSRLLANIDGTVKMFGSNYASRLLAESNEPVPRLSTVSRHVRDTIVNSQALAGSRARDLLVLAYACARDGDILDAAEIASGLVAEHGFEGQAYYARALFRLAGGDRVGGGCDLNEAIARRYNTNEASTLLGIIQLGDEPRKALEILEPLEVSESADASIHLGLSLAYWQVGDLSSAVLQADMAVSSGEMYAASAYLVRGCLHLELGNRAGAGNDFDQVIHFGEAGWMVNLLRGVAWRATDPAKAEESFNRAIEQHPIPVAFAERGAARTSLGRHVEAEADFSQAIFALPARPELRIARGVTRMLLRKWQAAESDFTAAIALGAGEGEVYSQRAAARSQQGSLTGAEQDLTEAIRLGNTSDEVLGQLFLVRGDIRWRQNRRDEAMDDFEAAHRLSRGRTKTLKASVQRIIRFLGWKPSTPPSTKTDNPEENPQDPHKHVEDTSK